MALNSYSPFRILAVAGMELSWLFGFLLLAHDRACGQCLFIPGIMGFCPVAFLVQRLIRKTVAGKVRRYAMSLLSYLLLAVAFTEFVTNPGFGFMDVHWFMALLRRIFSIAAFPTPELLTVAGAALFWGCGKRLSAIENHDSIALNEFQFGIFMLLILFFLGSQLSLDHHGLLPLTLVFFLFALTGLPMTLLYGGSGWSSNERRVRWLGVVFGGVCFVLAIGLIAALILKPDLLNLLLSFAKAIGKLIALWISEIISFLSRFLPEPDGHRIELPPPPSPAETDPSFIVKMLKIPESVRKVTGLLMGAIWLFLILAALWTLSRNLLQWLLQKASNIEDAEVETLSGAFREDLLLLLRILGRRIGRFFVSALRIFGIRKAGSAGPPKPVSAREVYRQLLRWTKRRGFPRNNAQTPGEYLDVLVKTFPGGYNEFSFITTHYIKERYGPIRTATDILEQLHTNWQRVKRIGRRTLSKHSRPSKSIG